MSGRHPEECSTDPRIMRMEEINWGYRRMETSFDGSHCPAGAVVPYMDE